MTNQDLVSEIVGQFGEKVADFSEPHGLLTFTTDRNTILEVLTFLYSSETLRFSFITDITGVHFPDNKGGEFAVVYHLHSFENGIRVRVKVYLPQENPSIPTATSIYPGANWMERETFDFYGIIFEGHPNLKRILNIEEMDYFPMRKEYPLEDATREDKIDALFGR